MNERPSLDSISSLKDARFPSNSGVKTASFLSSNARKRRCTHVSLGLQAAAPAQHSTVISGSEKG